MDFESYRNDFALLQNTPVIYFDNAASSLTPEPVIEAMNDYYRKYRSNVHRGLHQLSEKASQAFEETRVGVADFIHAKQNEIVYTKNTTESLNIVMHGLVENKHIGKDDVILVSACEHHANLVPWQIAAEKTGAKLEVVKVKEDFTFDYDDFENKFTDKVKVVALAHASNTMGTILPIEAVGKRVKDSNALFVLDAAQSVGHMPLDVKKTEADFIAFSSHKMYGPTGLGVLYGKEEALEALPPLLYGGSMISDVKQYSSTFDKAPMKFEAGTPAIAEVIGLHAAVKYLKAIGMKNIRTHEKELTVKALNALQEMDGVTVYGPRDAEKQVGIVSFDHAILEAHDLALALDETANIATRSGMHCCQPLIEKCNPNGVDRISFGLFNTETEVQTFIDALQNILNHLQ